MTGEANGIPFWTTTQNGDLTRVRPTICIPDDHDVFHGNLWGAGGELAKARNGITAQDAGGYKMPAKFVNAVHSTQVSHLPPSQVSSFIGQGISTYTTSFVWGGIDFCVLADRMWKDSPTVGAPQLKFKNGWPQAEDYQPKDADSPGLQLLGVEQEHFLESWAAERLPDTWTKVVLSQSPFACLHTLPGVQKGGFPPQNLENILPTTSQSWTLIRTGGRKLLEIEP